LWLRFLTLQRLQLVHRRQLGTKARDASRVVSIHGGTYPAATSSALAAQLLGRDTRASEVAIRAERKRQLQDALDRMDPVDREVLVLRHFEQLSNGECARVPGLSESGASKRHLRALGRLKEILSALPGGSKGGGGMSGESTSTPDDDPLGPVVESFLARFRRGERPALTDPVASHPELAGRIREVIPALCEKSNRKFQAKSACEACGHRAHADRNAARNIASRAQGTL
jgi:RNA polymerase sigma factor (sigma-70 family)